MSIEHNVFGLLNKEDGTAASSKRFQCGAMPRYAWQFKARVELCAACPIRSRSSCKTFVGHNTPKILGEAAAASDTCV
jgi:hypothetical protein